jgi:hypothetical protein
MFLVPPFPSLFQLQYDSLTITRSPLNSSHTSPVLEPTRWTEPALFFVDSLPPLLTSPQECCSRNKSSFSLGFMSHTQKLIH